LNLGKLIYYTFSIYFKNGWQVMCAVIPLVAIGAVAGWGITHVIVSTFVTPATAKEPGIWTVGSVFQLIWLILLAILIWGVIYTLINNILVHVVGQRHQTRQISLGNALSAGVRKFVTVSLAGACCAIIIAVLAITIIGIPFAIYFGIRWVFVAHAVLFEGKGVSGSLSRSSELTKNNWWEIFACVLVFGLFAYVISEVLQTLLLLPYFLSASFAKTMGYFPFRESISYIITWPITIISTTLIYFGMRVKKEQYNAARLKIDMDIWDTGAGPAYPVAEAQQSSDVPANESNNMFCPSCGKPTSTKTGFCSSCEDTGTNDGPFIK
jgi:hypothetical protein